MLFLYLPNILTQQEKWLRFLTFRSIIALTQHLGGFNYKIKNQTNYSHCNSTGNLYWKPVL